MKKKRETKQIRISTKWHAYLKGRAKEQHTRISRVADLAVEVYSGEYARNKAEIDAKLAILYPLKAVKSATKLLNVDTDDLPNSNPI
jgi:DNA relaxase NicK